MEWHDISIMAPDEQLLQQTQHEGYLMSHSGFSISAPYDVNHNESLSLSFSIQTEDAHKWLYLDLINLNISDCSTDDFTSLTISENEIQRDGLCGYSGLFPERVIKLNAGASTVDFNYEDRGLGMSIRKGFILYYKGTVPSTAVKNCCKSTAFPIPPIRSLRSITTHFENKHVNVK